MQSIRVQLSPKAEALQVGSLQEAAAANELLSLLKPYKATIPPYFVYDTPHPIRLSSVRVALNMLVDLRGIDYPTYGRLLRALMPVDALGLNK